ncbi:MAG: toll/interleukin-1 receptor domain-containing protein, partial [Blastocatellia bacterium]
MDRPTVFISYSHRDEAWKNMLRPHLAILEQTGQIDIWDDRQIDAGDEWFQRIRQTMQRAAVAVCLISADYLSSDFCQKEEIPFLLDRRQQDGMLLSPLLVRPCLWKAVPWLRQLQMLPRDNKSISADFKDNADGVFATVAEQIYDYISGLDPVPVSLGFESRGPTRDSGPGLISIGDVRWRGNKRA